MKTQADVYPDNLVIPGTEVTTYRGHWNNQGSSNFADFRTGPVYEPSALSSPIPDSALVEERGPVPPKTEFANAQAGGGWTQINHPATFKDDPAGCRGCAWTYSDADTDFSKVDAIEVHNSFGTLSKQPVHARRDRLLRARARQRRPHRGDRIERRPQGGHRHHLPRRRGRDGGRRRGPEQAGHHRRGQGRPHLREAVRPERARRLARRAPTPRRDGDHRRLAERLRHRADGDRERDRRDRPDRRVGARAASGRRPDRLDADHRRRDQPGLRRLGVGPLRDRGDPDGRQPACTSRTTRARSG